MEVEEYLTIIAQNIKKMRANKGFSIRELSQLSGIQPQYLSKIENVNAKRINLLHLEFLSKALDIQTCALLTKD